MWAWVDAAMGGVEVQGPDEDGSFVTTAAGVQGAIGCGPTKETAIDDLRSALSVWAGCKLSMGDKDIPVIGGVDLHRA